METESYHKIRISLQSFEMCIYTDHEIKKKNTLFKKSCLFDASLNGRPKIKFLGVNKYFL